MKMATLKPYKIWNCERTLKKSVTAVSLADLRAKGCVKLELIEPVRVVLEADGTEIDDEEYFTFVDPNSTLMLLKQDEKWKPPGMEVWGHDVTDFAGSPTNDIDPTQVVSHVRDLASALTADIARIVTFSSVELQALVDTNTDQLSTLLNDQGMARAVQETAQQHLDNREQTQEAVNLLKLYHRAKQHKQAMDDIDSGVKRKRDS